MSCKLKLTAVVAFHLESPLFLCLVFYHYFIIIITWKLNLHESTKIHKVVKQYEKIKMSEMLHFETAIPQSVYSS